jgi:hypothetical protein
MSVYKRGVGDQGLSHFPKKFVTLYASAATVAGQFVALTADTTNGLGASCSNAVVGLGSTQHNALTFGIATQTVAAGEDVVVQVAGKYENAYVEAAVVAGSALCGPLSGGTAGMAGLLAETTFGPTVAIALEDDSAVTNYADVMIINQGLF